jgi:gentisate 1,2-dioxygenase
MTGMLEHEGPGLGHNKALEGTYSHLYKKLLEEPRVYSSKDHPWKGGPAMYGKHVISPQAVNIVQSIESHIECYAPLNAGQKHGHLNSAVFYVLKGHGHDVHDGRTMTWQAGDVMLVENGCVHQHFNDDPDEDCILLVFKAKPLFLFMHLLFQKMVEWPTDKLPPGHEDFKPPTDI